MALSMEGVVDSKCIRWSVVAAMMMMTAAATTGTVYGNPITRVRTRGVSVSAVFSDEAVGFVSVSASIVSVNGVEEVFLSVEHFDFMTGIEACGSALIPRYVLDVGRQQISLDLDLAAVEWDFVCDEGPGTPTGLVRLTFTPDGASRTKGNGSRHDFFPTFLIHSNGTFEDNSARVTGEMLNVITPLQSIQGTMSRSNSLVISVERRSH